MSFDDFDKRFDRHMNRVDKMVDHPVRSFIKVGSVALALNLLFFIALVFLVLFAIKVVF